jgi:hypothetical protein
MLVSLDGLTAKSIARANKVVENLHSWDDAISHAKARIKQLKNSLRTFEEHRKRGEPWPGTQLDNHAA